MRSRRRTVAARLLSISTGTLSSELAGTVVEMKCNTMSCPPRRAASRSAGLRKLPSKYSTSLKTSEVAQVGRRKSNTRTRWPRWTSHRVTKLPRKPPPPSTTIRWLTAHSFLGPRAKAGLDLVDHRLHGQPPGDSKRRLRNAQSQDRV